MNKRILAAALALTMSACICGCSESEKTTADRSVSPKETVSGEKGNDIDDVVTDDETTDTETTAEESAVTDEETVADPNAEQEDGIHILKCSQRFAALDDKNGFYFEVELSPTEADSGINVALYDDKGEKVTDLKEEGGKYPELDMIRLDFAGGGWQKNDAETTPEREVYYYGSAVAPGRSTPDLVTGLTLDSSITQAVTRDPAEGGTVVTYKYKYDGWQLCIEAQAQSVQTHNADEAIKSIWGVQNVSASETSLTVE